MNTKAQKAVARMQAKTARAIARKNQSGAAVAEIVSIIAAVSIGFGGFVSYCRSLADAAGETRAAAIEAVQASLR
jgi:hypothetical protein